MKRCWLVQGRKSGFTRCPTVRFSPNTLMSFIRTSMRVLLESVNTFIDWIACWVLALSCYRSEKGYKKNYFISKLFLSLPHPPRKWKDACEWVRSPPEVWSVWQPPHADPYICLQSSVKLRAEQSDQPCLCLLRIKQVESVVCLVSSGDRDVPRKWWPGSFCHLRSKGNRCGGQSASLFHDISPTGHLRSFSYLYD